ncbi:hypothetical protein J3U21_04670 [Gilliamella sp. B2776]|uniref:hypothetical protein n=1 Tax=unclassified Gilliamella TaxID=2685620 RepID=UPI00226A88A4|nr:MULTISPECIES: hypothetical protein [unclassified Gilliamella]MCX8578690.1 hypothetical protein [Gilliamella sp. B2717]MCX8649572.1 hypothetical protein [Gilliamella sp. B2779]MCX8653853.1 hypothetical protein [Gilliamella sp. B2737]MCX8691438.1 hypothetical protein [Gilliamella sp. B2776]MCX8702501.1 hypothetical protein [Gilliamella sp. B2781]
MSNILILQDIPDLKCDCCIANNDSELIFLSVWGKDTAMQELFAKLTIGETTKHGLKDIKLNHHRVFLAEGKHYAKRTLKVTKTLFGSLIHAFIFDKRIIEPNRDSNSMISIYKKEDISTIYNRYFDAIKTLSSVPFLEHWADEIVSIAKQQGMIKEHKAIVGDIDATTIIVNDTILTQIMSQNIRDGILTLL